MNYFTEIRNFFKILFIDFEKNPRINSKEFLKKVFNYIYLMLVFIFIFFIALKIIFILIFNTSVEINYINISIFNYFYFFILDINFKLIFSFFFLHVLLYLSYFISDYFKDFKIISLLLKISISLSLLEIYIYYITLNNIEIFNKFFNLIILCNKMS